MAVHEWVGAISSAASAAIAAGGLGFIWYQVKLGTVALKDQARAAEHRARTAEHLARSARSEAKARLLELSEPINRLLFENPALYDMSYVGSDATVPERGTDMWKQAMIICEMQANYIEFVIREIDILSPSERAAWQNFVRDTFHRPVFRAFWAERRAWFDRAIEAFATETAEEPPPAAPLPQR